MHSGHFNAVRQAKQVCDILIVGIHSDEEIERNKAKPIMKEAERYALLKHIKWIDEIIYDAPYTPTLEFTNKHKIDFVIHGDDLPMNSEGKCAYEDMIAAGKFKMIRRTEGVSTTYIVGKLLSMSRGHLAGPLNQGTPLAGSFEEATGSHSMLTTTRRIAEFSSRRVPTPDDVVVYVNGSFDLFNVAHSTLLETAKSMGTFLIVGVFDDATVHHMKGANYPIMLLHERVLNVSACKHVDEVLIGAPFELSEEIIKNLNIAFVVEGSQSTAKNAGSRVPTNAVPKQLGSFKVIESQWPDLTVDAIVQRIIDNRVLYMNRNQKRESLEKEFYKNRQPNLTEY
jgi:ethanolamine-phosphate cytidylyltransferase